MQVFWLQRQQELLLGRQAELSAKVSAASEALESLKTRRHTAVFDVDVQLRLKQGQVRQPTALESRHHAERAKHAGVL